MEIKTLLENARDALAEVPEMIGSDAPHCHRVKIALANVNSALDLLAVAAPAV